MKKTPPKRISKRKTSPRKTSSRSPKSPRKKKISPRRSPIKTRSKTRKLTSVEEQIKSIPHTNYYIDIDAEQQERWKQLKDAVLLYQEEPSPENFSVVQDFFEQVKYAPSKLKDAMEELEHISFASVEEKDSKELFKEILSIIWIFEHLDIALTVKGVVYQCTNVMAIGGQGIIMNARERGTKNEFVVKMVAYDMKELKDEMEKLVHFKKVKGVVKAISPLITIEDTHSIVYACIFPKYGPTLSHLYKYEEFNFSEDFVKWAVKEVSSILDKIHQLDFIHLDIHPSNILLGPYDFSQRTYEPKLYLIDFGICCKQNDMSTMGDIGVVKYSSPYIGERIPIWKDDYVSLVFTLYFLHEGNLPWFNDEQFYEARKKKIKFLEEGEYKKVKPLADLL